MDSLERITAATKREYQAISGSLEGVTNPITEESKEDEKSLLKKDLQGFNQSKSKSVTALSELRSRK